eukprot:s166_g26.t1
MKHRGASKRCPSRVGPLLIPGRILQATSQLLVHPSWEKVWQLHAWGGNPTGRSAVLLRGFSPWWASSCWGTGTSEADAFDRRGHHVAGHRGSSGFAEKPNPVLSPRTARPLLEVPF